MMGLAFLSVVLMAIPQAVQQKTSGWCSPAIANVVGNITVTCVGVDPRALAHLNVLLNRKKQELADKIRQADEWARRYFELEKRLSDPSDETRLSKEAEEYLHAGELDKAEAILNVLLQKEELDVDRDAANQYNLALIKELEFQPLSALPHFEKAYQYRRQNVAYANDYANALERVNRLREASSVYQLNLVPLRKLAENNPEIIPSIALTLFNLGYTYANSGREREAKASYQECLELYRQLATTNPRAYLMLQVKTLDGLCTVYDETEASDESERCYSETRDLYKRAVTDFGIVGSADGAMILDHLGAHYERTKNLKGAEAMYQDVLQAARQMERDKPGVNGWFFAIALEHLGELYHRQHRLTEAESAYVECLNILAHMPDEVPAYELLRSATLNGLGNLYSETERPTDAAKLYQRALSIDRMMTDYDPANGYVGSAIAQRGLGMVYANLGQLGRAEEADKEAIRMFRQVVIEDQTYVIPLAGTLFNLGEAYRKDAKLSLAKSSYEQALDLYRRLAIRDPATHIHDVAVILNVLGSLNQTDHKFSDAVDCFKQSLEAYRRLSRMGQAYGREEASVLGNLAYLGVDHHMPLEQAKAYVDEALTIQTGLWNANPSLYGDDLAASFITKAQLLGIPGPREREACGFIKEAQRHATSEINVPSSRLLITRCNSL